MDFNAIEERLKRTLSSLNGRYTDDLERSIITNNVKDGNKTIFSASFGKSSLSEIENKVLIILHNLASLKDNLKNCLQRNGHDPKVVEAQIDSSLHLKVLIDLVNEEKHGYPLTKSNRSLKGPVVKNVRQSVAVYPDSGAQGALFFVTQDGGSGTINGKSVMFIDADIYDSGGSYLFSLDELVVVCYRNCVTIANTYN